MRREGEEKGKKREGCRGGLRAAWPVRPAGAWDRLAAARAPLQRVSPSAHGPRPGGRPWEPALSREEYIINPALASQRSTGPRNERSRPAVQIRTKKIWRGRLLPTCARERGEGHEHMASSTARHRAASRLLSPRLAPSDPTDDLAVFLDTHVGTD